MYAQVVGETPEDLMVVLRNMGVKMKNKELHLDPRPLLKLTLQRFFGKPKGFVDMIVKHVPSPIEGNLTHSTLQGSNGRYVENFSPYLKYFHSQVDGIVKPWKVLFSEQSVVTPCMDDVYIL